MCVWTAEGSLAPEISAAQLNRGSPCLWFHMCNLCNHDIVEDTKLLLWLSTGFAPHIISEGKKNPQYFCFCFPFYTTNSVLYCTGTLLLMLSITEKKKRDIRRTFLWLSDVPDAHGVTPLPSAASSMFKQNCRSGMLTCPYSTLCFTTCCFWVIIISRRLWIRLTEWSA